ncbi:CCHC-type domain-containing protein [Abeliophyllum distichum]|uniref:CCHC-type domain-containing protein n=1 Tax=Abeliophyllum distichum TaxID=126358 RepID=A0ABD1UNY2_9LAMI
MKTEIDTNGSNVVSPTNGATNVIPPMAIPVQTTSVLHGEKPVNFSGVEFKRWQQKMLFYLTTLNLARFLSENPPTVQEGINKRESRITLDAWKHYDFFCKNYILDGLIGQYTMYSAMKTAKRVMGIIGEEI